MFFTGTSIKITRDHIAFSDKDDADSKIQIILATDITHGHFQVMESSGTQNIEIGGNFSQEDVNEGRVRSVICWFIFCLTLWKFKRFHLVFVEMVIHISVREKYKVFLTTDVFISNSFFYIKI